LPNAGYEPPLISYRLVGRLAGDAFEAIMQNEEIEEELDEEIEDTLDALTVEANELQKALMEEED
jgi:hypothetical protein